MIGGQVKNKSKDIGLSEPRKLRSEKKFEKNCEAMELWSSPNSRKYFQDVFIENYL